MSEPAIATTDERGNFTGYEPRECGDHRTVGGRAWCHDCTEWCYESMPCRGCEIESLRTRAEAAEAEIARLRSALEAVVTAYEVGEGGYEMMVDARAALGEQS